MIKYLEFDSKLLGAGFLFRVIQCTPANGIVGRLERLHVEVFGQQLVEDHFVHLLPAQQQPVPAGGLVQQQLHLTHTSLFPLPRVPIVAIQLTTLAEHCNESSFFSTAQFFFVHLANSRSNIYNKKKQESTSHLEYNNLKI